MTTPFVTSAFDLPSKRRAALRATVAGSAAEAERITAENAESAEEKRRKFFMASIMKFRRRKQERPTIDKGDRFRHTGAMRRACIFSVIVLVVANVVQCSAEDFATLSKFADDFWTWRAKYAPFTGDDVNRIERPGPAAAGRNWSRASMEAREQQLLGFEERYRQIDYTKWPIPQQVDYRLIGSALARVRYEIEVNARWKRDPNFYVEQTLTALLEALTLPGPYNESHSREILNRLQNI